MKHKFSICILVLSIISLFILTGCDDLKSSSLNKRYLPEAVSPIGDKILPDNMVKATLLQYIDPIINEVNGLQQKGITFVKLSDTIEKKDFSDEIALAIKDTNSAIDKVDRLPVTPQKKTETRLIVSNLKDLVNCLKGLQTSVNSGNSDSVQNNLDKLASQITSVKMSIN